MASLPNKSFLFNINARDYDASTYSFPRENGASITSAITFSYRDGGNPVVHDGYLTIPAGTHINFLYTSTGANPFNISSVSDSMTIVFKAKTTSGENLIGNRSDASYDGQSYGGTYNYMFRDKETYYTIHFSSEGNANVPITRTNPVTISYVFNNGSVSGYNWTTSTQGATSSYGTRTGSSRFGLFTGNYSGENWAGDFYWMYISKTALTDAEIEQVIAYNESAGIDISPTGTTIAQSGGTSTTNIEAETGWTVTTKPTWVTVSPSSGESGTTAVTFTIKKNNFSSRTGTVVFTDDGGNEAEYTIDQGGTDGLVPFEKMYRNERRIN